MPATWLFFHMQNVCIHDGGRVGGEDVENGAFSVNFFVEMTSNIS